MEVIKEITIDLWKKYTAPIEINQYEAEGRSLKINITAGSLPVNLTGVNVSLHAKKPDGHVTHNACTIIDAVNGKVLYEITGQTCIKDGELECCLVLINSGPAELRSQTFIITVKPSPDISSSIESTSEFTALTEALADVAGLTPSGSLVQDEDGLHLVGDEADPGNNKYYGTDEEGNKGYHCKYDIGAIYWNTTDPTSPAIKFGGVWARIKDVFLLAAGDTYAAGATGGASTVSLTGPQNGPHAHGAGGGVFPNGDNPGSISSSVAGGTAFGFWYSLTAPSSGNGEPHENMPPYRAVYCWERTA